MANDRKSDGYAQNEDPKSAATSALKLGLVSAASALVGGLAAAWWYRKTLTKLQNPIANEDLYRAEAHGLVGEAAESGENDDLPHLVND